MSIYNVEQYIEEAIESIINQDIGFEENVQIIFVNDGSPDNSEDICLKYKELYPDNIVYIKKENSGLSAARNVGLKYVQGEYVTFTDPDDTLTSNVLSSVYKFFEKNKLCVDMVAIPLYFFEARKGLHEKYKYMGKKDRIISLIKEPYNFVLSSASMFYKTSKIKNMRYDENMYGGEDLKFNLELYMQNPNIGYVCEWRVKYNYRQRKEANSIVDSLKFNKQGFTSILRSLELLDINNLADYQKEAIIYELRSRLKNMKKEYFDSEKEYNDLLKEYKKYLNAIPDDFILSHSRFSDTNELKALFMQFRNKTIEECVINNLFQLELHLNIKSYYVENNKFVVNAVYNNFGVNDAELVAFDGDNNIYYPVVSKDIDGPYNSKYGEFVLDCSHYRKFEFDISSKIIKFIIKYKDNYIPLKKITCDKLSKLFLKYGGVGLRYKNYLITLASIRKFKIKKCNDSTFKYNFLSILKIFKHYHYIPLMRLFNQKNKKYILINDRPEKAGDNGEALFKYICANEKEMAKYTYFVIDKKSPDYERMKKYGNVVNIRSIKHRFLYLNSKWIYSSHTHRLFYNAFDIEKIKYYSDMFDNKLVWLQHGITKDDISESANKIHIKFNNVITATNDEYNEFAQDKYFFENEDILLTGFARYDYLENKPENVITICPTWRKTLSGKILLDGTHDILDNFDATDYYMNYKKILESKTLYNILKKYDYKLNFVLHPGTIGYKEYFEIFENDRIHILNQDEINYSDIFSQSKLLITDYSSVFFDFAYLKKPEIFFQFDKQSFFETHYKAGYFSYEKDAFGDVITDPKDLINKIEYYFKNDFKVEKKYLDRIDNTFRYTDKNNCKRIIDMTYKKNKNGE